MNRSRYWYKGIIGSHRIEIGSIPPVTKNQKKMNPIKEKKEKLESN